MVRKLILSLALLLTAASATFAQRIDKLYLSRLTENGMLYFIRPMELFKDKSTVVDMDITRLVSQDFVTVNYSVSLDSPHKLDSVTFVRNGRQYSFETDKYYIESSKKRWTHRYSFRVPVSDLRDIFCGDSSVTFTVYDENRNAFEYVPTAKWDKHSAVIEKILMMIELN